MCVCVMENCFACLNICCRCCCKKEEDNLPNVTVKTNFNCCVHGNVDVRDAPQVDSPEEEKEDDHHPRSNKRRSLRNLLQVWRRRRSDKHRGSPVSSCKITPTRADTCCSEQFLDQSNELHSAQEIGTPVISTTTNQSESSTEPSGC